jgi:hypothetical protein
MLLLGAAFLIAAHAQNLWQFQLSIGLCVGIGIAFIGNVPIPARAGATAVRRMVPNSGSSAGRA